MSCVNSLQLAPQIIPCRHYTYNQQELDSIPHVRGVSQKNAGNRHCGWGISSNQYTGFGKSINRHTIWIFIMIIIRVGEAKNPGPGLDVDTLNIYHCNPTALVGKEHEIASWGSGITLVSETSATARAQRVIQCNLAKNNIKSIWSKPVTPYRQSSGEMRGIAGGTAIFSNFPARKTLEPLPDDILESDRYAEAIVQFAPGYYIFCVALYGAVIGQRYYDSLGITNRLFSVAAQRAVKFQGPSIIVGDLNCSLNQLSLWPSLVKQGWIDTAMKSAEVNHHSIEMTYDNIARHSYILTSSHLRGAMIDCRTVKPFVFSKHPVIKLRLNMCGFLQPKYVWQLPKSFDQFSHDPVKAESVANIAIQNRNTKLNMCFDKNDIEEVSKQWTVIAEETLRYSALDKQGNCVVPKLGHIGRSCKNPIQAKSQAIPIMKKPRDDHYIPNVDQGSVELRRHVKQLHRIQSLASQTRALEKNYCEQAKQQALHLWKSIQQAKGFHESFVHWMYNHGFLCIPTDLPGSHFVDQLGDTFHKHLRSLESDFRLFKSKIRQLDIITDLQHGAALAFREVKNQALPPLDEIRFEIQATVMKVKWPKEGLRKIWLTMDNPFTVGQKVCFQNQESIVVGCHKRHIELDNPLKLRSDDYKVVCKTATADPVQMQDMVKTAWSRYFVRDSYDTDEDNWKEASKFLNLVESCETMTYQPITPDMLSVAIQSTKTKSARGADGFTTLDLRKLPLCVWALLCRIFFHIEKYSGEWPNLWTLAKTLCLPKSETTKSPMDIRPITILSKTYRIWAKIRGKQIAQHLAEMVPATIGGPCKGISSELIAQFTSIEIENALYTDTRIQGMVLDLVKCYNAIPREPLYQILERLGVHSCYINAFSKMLKNMRRSFEINGNTDHKPWKTSTGIVEGCGVAVACMLALGVWCNSVITSCDPQAKTIMFADNWAVITNHIYQLQKIIDQILGFLNTLKMEMSPQKSWLWATKSEDRKHLKEIKINGQAIPIALHAKDLGVDQVYTKRYVCTTKRTKVRKTIQKMKTIRDAKLPNGSRKRIAMGAGLAIRTYGIATQMAAKAEYKSIRAATCAALRRTAGNASPWLALNTHDNNLDPQWRDITQAIQAWKRFLKFFPHQKLKLISILASDRNNLGAIGKLKAWCHRLGWTFRSDDSGTMVNGSKAFSWIDSPISTFKKIVGRDWSSYVATNCQHRKYFDIPDIDTINLKKIYDKASYLDRRFLEHQFTGRAFTNDEISKFDGGNEGKCPACGLPDSRQHRLFQCKETKNLRQGKSHIISKIAKAETARWYHGIISIPKGYDKHLEFLLKIPQISPGKPLRDMTCQHLFLDGTAFFNNTGYWAIAGAAVVKVTPGSFDAICLEKRLVPDVQQSSFHGELAAVAVALNRAWKCTLYSDCQAVVTLIQQLIDAINLGYNIPDVEHSIWRTIKQQMCDRPKNSVNIIKVKAHQDWKKLPEGVEKWKAYANDYADRSAKQVVTKDNKQYYKWLTQKVTEHNHNVEIHREFLTYVCEVGQVFAKLQASKNKTKCQNDSNFDLHHACLCRNTIGVQRNIQIPRNLYLAFPWGPAFLYRVVRWAMGLRWCKGRCSCVKDISMLELFFDFATTTGSLSPVCLTPKNKRKDTKDGKRHSCWELADLSIEADMKGQLPLAEHTKVFGRAMEFLIHNGNPLQWPVTKVPKTKSLCFIGLSTASRGFACRPTLVNHDECLGLLRNYLCTPTGMRRDLKAPLKLDKAPMEVPDEYVVPYRDRIPYLYRTYQHYLE